MATINVATARDKEEKLVEVMRVRKLDMLALAETRLNGCGDEVIHDDYRMIFSGREDGRHGVALILGPKLANFVAGIQQMSERIIGIDLKLEQNISIAQVYAPQRGGLSLKKINFTGNCRTF